MILELIVAALIPALLSLILTPVVIRCAHAVKAVDLPNERKIHKQPIPRLGGVVIYASFFLSLLLFLSFSPFARSQLFLMPEKAISLVIALLVVLFLGICDDIRALNPGKKFLVQVLAATIVYLGGFRISTITDLLGSGSFHLGLLDYPITVLWIVGVTNAFNLIDGLDGLASGVAIIASSTMFAIAILKDELAPAYLVLILVGAIIGFLPYNFNPARIFLGDSGSLFIGFTLSIFSMQSSTKGSTAFAILMPVLALGLPIMDTLLSMARRVLYSLMPEGQTATGLLSKLHSMFVPDRRHVHHQLIALGLSQRNVVLILYLVSCAFGLVAFSVTVSNNFAASLILLAVGVATVAGVKHLRYREIAILRNGLLLPMYEWPIFNRTLFQGFLDLGFSVAAFYAAYLLSFDGNSINRPRFITVAPWVCGTQMIVFLAGGLYKGTFRLLGIGDLLKIVKTCIVAVLAAGIVLSVLHDQRLLSLQLLITNFYVLLSLIAGTRASFHVFNYIFRRETKIGKGILIYGAGANGMLTLQKILQDDEFPLQPLGFIDEDPRLEGKNVNGFRIYGGHWKLPRLLQTNKVEEIIIACESLTPEIMKRVKRTTTEHGVRVKHSRLLLVDLPFEAQHEESQERAEGIPADPKHISAVA